jgi:hypothetical protein
MGILNNLHHPCHVLSQQRCPGVPKDRTLIMSNAQQVHSVGGHSQDSLDDAEKGTYDSTLELIAPPPFIYTSEGRPKHIGTLLSPVSPVHEGITPCTSVPKLSLLQSEKVTASHIEVVETKVKNPALSKPKISRWILFELWYNTYRRFFTFVVTLNIIGMILAALGRFQYAENHMGALVLGNLLCAILMRNELFIRFLYLVAIYGLRSVRIHPVSHYVSAADKLVSGRLYLSN